MIDEALLPDVVLADGGELHIERTKVCWTIDVDSGKSTIPLKDVNKNACSEIARQIRLKNMGGLILVDFAGSKRIQKALEKELVENGYINRYNFLNKKTSLNVIHNPSTNEKLKEVTIRLKYEELFQFMFKINYLKLQNKKKKSGLERKIDRDKLDKFMKKIPFELTNDQLNAVEEILNDLEAPNRMNRLLQGDVGSGKTIVAFIGMLANHYSGYQSALMAPTEILAIQHFNNMKQIFKNSKIIQMKTDNRKLFEYSLKSLVENGYKIDEINLDLYEDNIEDNVPTEYETKFVRIGKKIYRGVFRKN